LKEKLQKDPETSLPEFRQVQDDLFHYDLQLNTTIFSKMELILIKLRLLIYPL